MRSFKASNGTAAYGTASAPSIRKLSSGMHGLRLAAAPVLQFGKETLYLFPHLGAAGQAFPVQADKADQAITLINRRQETFPCGAHAVDQQCFHISLHGLQSAA